MKHVKHWKRLSFPCTLLTILAFLLPRTGVASATAVSNCGQWNVVSSPNVKSTNVLTAVTAVSANDVWATGYSEGAKLKPLIDIGMAQAGKLLPALQSNRERYLE